MNRKAKEKKITKPQYHILLYLQVISGILLRNLIKISIKRSPSKLEKKCTILSDADS